MKKPDAMCCSCITVFGELHTSPYLKFARKDYSLNTYVEKHQVNSRKLPNIPDMHVTMEGLGVHFWAMTYRC